MTVTPSPSSQRLHIIDAIRGLAVFGILIANIFSWSGYKFIPLAEIEALPLFHWDGLLLQLNQWFVDAKFYAIFSMLFGAGFGLQYMKNQQLQAPFIKKYRRRLAFLLMFGVLHALLWSGDILTLYALLAFVLVLLRNISFDRLLPLAIFLLCLFALPQLVMLLFSEPVAIKEILAHKNYSDMAPQELTDTFGHGGWREVFVTNLHNLYWRWLDMLPNGRISRVLGLFVLGFYLARAHYFTSSIYSSKHLFVYLLIAAAASVSVHYTGTNISKWAVSGTDIVMKMVLVMGQICLALAYMSMLAKVFQYTLGEKLLNPLTLIGRMAFTCYLMQTVIGISIFYGVGFGIWGSMGLAQIWGLAVFIYALQVLFCSVWLTFFKQGPVEWLWGSLTAGQFRSNWREQTLDGSQS